MNVIHRSSSGCHVAVGDVAPDTHVSNKMKRRRLTNLSVFDEQRHFSLSLAIATLHRITRRLFVGGCHGSLLGGIGRCWWCRIVVVVIVDNVVGASGGRSRTEATVRRQLMHDVGKGRGLCLFGNRCAANKQCTPNNVCQTTRFRCIPFL
jgi:hypothetical protein